MRSVDDIVKDISELRIGDANEATTRQRIIDDILYIVLGWAKDEVTPEERTSEDGKTGFIDYLFSCAQANILVEAKRINARLDNLPDQRRLPLKGTWLKGDAGEAVRQARDYARSKGVGFAAVTNGDAWIIFPVNRRDLVSFEDSQAIIFKSARVALDADREQFIELMSRAAIINGALDTALLGSERDQIDARRLNAIYDRSFSQVKRVSVFSHIEQEIITAFSEELLGDNPEILEKAYVDTPDRVRFDNRIQMHITKREQVLAHRPLRPVSRTGDMQDIAGRISTLKVATRPVALLALGLVGSGKTTFLNYVAKVTARAHFAHNPARATAHWIYVDFRDYTADISPRTYTIIKAFDYVSAHPFLKDYERCLKHAYAAEIDTIKTGPLALFANQRQKIDDAVTDLMMTDFKAREPYVLKVLSYAAKHAPVFLVIDNVDQREQAAVQSAIFLEALSLARTLHANLVLAMRDATYLRNKSAPVFDAFDFDAVYIDPPAIQSVLSKRFAIARNLLSGKSFEFDTDGARMKVQNAAVIVDMLSAGVLNTSVGRLIEVAATGDTRLALKMTRQFLQYGYSSSTRAIQVYNSTGAYNLPPHEALRAIMCGNQSIYIDELSPIGNPFDAKLHRSQAQFLRLYIMSVLVYLAAERSFEGLEAAEIIGVLEKLGFSERTSEAVIRDLIDDRYVFSRSHQDYSRESVLIPSRLAGYVVRDLIGRFVFIENTMFDTFISDDATWSTIKGLVRDIYAEHKDRTKRFRLRKQAAQLFFDYVAKGIQRLVDQAQVRNIPPVWCRNPMELMRRDFELDLQRALRSALRNYGSGQEASEDLPLFNRPR
jgi:hypothetical protein